MRRSVLLLLVLASALLGSLVWLGLRIARDEERFVRAEFIDALRGQLQNVSSSIDSWREKREGDLTSLLDGVPGNADGAREFLRRNPFVEHFFMLDENGRLILPNRAARDLSESEERFIERTRAIWEGRRYKRQLSGDSGSLYKQTPVWWHAYYWNDGLHLLLLREQHPVTIGFELSAPRFTADLLVELQIRAAALDEETSLIMRDGLGRVIFQSGSIPEVSLRPAAMLNLASPLESWKIEAFSAKTRRVGRAAYFNVLGGVVLLAAAVAVGGISYVRAQRRELREAMQRVTFVNQVSHELKTPLTNIRMYAELLEQRIPDEDEKARSHAQVIVSESQRLTRLISNVLAFSGREKRTLRFSPRPVLLSEVLRETLAQFAPSLADKQIRIETCIEEEGLVSADSDIVQQILSNLISNVEKYAAQGRWLRIELKAKPGRSSFVVRDQGPGILETEHERIFQPFYRISDKLTEGVAGAGIGLTIVRELARLHGGDVQVLKSGSGAVFEVTLSTPEEENAA